jgi:hypothetical protein
MNNTNSRIVLLALVATLAGASTQAQAQTESPDAFASLDMPTRPAAAAEMEQLADDLLRDGRGWERAAGLYRGAAELRGQADIKSAANLRLAGYVQFYDARHEASIISLTQAGEIFLAFGDVEAAAQSFIDAAWVAAQTGMAPEAVELSGRAGLLARSPLLRAAERTALERRLGAEAGLQ